MRIVSLLFLIVFGTNCDVVNSSIAGLKTPASSGKESGNQIGVDSRQAEEYAEKAVIKNGSKEGSRKLQDGYSYDPYYYDPYYYYEPKSADPTPQRRLFFFVFYLLRWIHIIMLYIIIL